MRRHAIGCDGTCGDVPSAPAVRHSSRAAAQPPAARRAAAGCRSDGRRHGEDGAHHGRHRRHRAGDRQEARRARPLAAHPRPQRLQAVARPDAAVAHSRRQRRGGVPRRPVQAARSRSHGGRCIGKAYLSGRAHQQCRRVQGGKRGRSQWHGPALRGQRRRAIPADQTAAAAHAPVDLRALSGAVRLSDGAAYAQSKLALTMWSVHMAKQIGKNGASVIAVNPASFLGTKMVKDAYGVAGKDMSIGADILVRAALSAEFANASGRYFDNDQGSFARPHPDALVASKNEKLVHAIDALLAPGKD
ncbi:oxidoreductase [Gracilaria domingensis]|nr:oxidoreductase [Gracilaria domingensis]